ncbi:MAG: hypothetical protein AB7T49_04960 [Oligoflexales bacterium]
MKSSLLAIPAIIVTLVGCSREVAPSSIKEAWNYRNRPQIFNVTEFQFDSLPVEGIIDDSKYPWSDDYWPTYGGGISKRWQITPPSTNYRDYQYPWLTRAQILNGTSPVSVEHLSPAEKYDLLRGRYDFPLAKRERALQEAAVDPSTGQIPYWYGLCHGWAPAAALEPEPGAVATMVNPDGLQIPFYTSDINALFTKIYADNLGSSVAVGERCYTENHEIEVDENNRIVVSNCRDTNPGALHVILAHYLGKADPLRRTTFIADVTRGSEVWNQPIVGFKIAEAVRTRFNSRQDPLARFRAPGTVELVKVTTEISYVGEIMPHRSPAIEHRNQYTMKQWLQYTLELNRAGEIIGGEWNGSSAPDFLWRMLAKPQTSGYLDYDTVVQIAEQSRVQ